MVVSEGAISNIMGGMENTAGVRLHSHRHKLKQRFDIIRKLGQGTYGKVQLAINKDTGQEVAIKTIKKAKIETEQDLVRIRREIQIMSSVQHPQIIHIYEVFENREKMVLVMEYAAGGELYDYLSERKVLSIDEARRVFRQVASAVYYCHKHKICHRDLKLENILLDIDGNAKIADFGLSNVFDEKRRLDTFCGSPLYASPEIVKGVPYVGPEVDCWSLGVLLYTLVYGAMPFDGSNFRRLVKQITQGDYYEPATPSSASPLVRGMLTVTAEKRANIADICSHWWVNEGHSTCCLDEAEALANQTPVRLDLLLSLAPKHISSEHMLIQPDDEDNSHRSEEGEQYSTSEIQLAPVPPVPPPPNGPQAAARSLSLGALTSAVARGADMAAVAPRRDEDKRRRESQAPATEAKKRKEADATSGHKSEAQLEEHEEEKRKARRKTTTRDEDGQEKTERKKSSRKKDAAVEGSPMETDDKLEKRASKTRETSIGDAEKVVNKGSSKTRDTTSASRESVKKRTAKKKELTDDKSSPPKSSVASMDTEVAATPSRDSTPKAPSPVEEMPKATRKSSHVSSETSSNTESKVASIRSPSNKSVISAISTDGTLRASDSSISTRHSVSPPKPVATAVNYNESKPPIKQVSSSTVSKPLQEDKVSKAPSTTRVVKTNSVAKVSKTTSPAKVSKNSSATKLSSSVVNGSCHDISNDTDKVLKETVSKIKEQNGSSTELIENKSKPAKRKTSNDALATNESVSSKESSQHSSVDTTPARSRTGSESSNEARSGGRQDSGSRRGSKIFSKAAMWDNMCNQQQNEKPPPSADKTRKTPRPGGLNMSDLTKKFEEKPPSDRKKPVVGSFKISDVKKSFENKSSDKVGAGFRRTSTDSSVDFKKEDSLPLSPSRSLKKEASLPPPGKSIRKVDSSIVEREKPVLPPKEKESSPVKETTKHVEKSDNEVIVEKDKPVNKAAVTSRGSSSPTKDVPKKAKSPVKEHTPKRDIGRGRDVTTPKRTSPIKDKPKAVSIAIKKTVATHPAPRRDVVTSDIERTKAPDNKEKTRPPSIGVATTERITSPPPTKFESSDSSDSESEAERLLRQLSERRERIEAAKKEKLRKVSQQQQQQREENEKSSSESSRISRPCRTGERTAAKSSLPPLETPSDTPDDMIPVKPPRSIPQASMISDAEQPSGAKYATLPRGFKSRAAEKEVRQQSQEEE
uniref:Mucin-4-like n=3 Tax=Hirondellea gigas TaxID=1518452 RepID=A0A6A7FUW8_9CRUS